MKVKYLKKVRFLASVLFSIKGSADVPYEGKDGLRMDFFLYRVYHRKNVFSKWKPCNTKYFAFFEDAIKEYNRQVRCWILNKVHRK